MKRKHGKGKALLLAAALVVCCGIGGTLAWLSAATEPVVNTFTPAQVTTEIQETVENGVKQNVSVKNTGDVDAYIRAKIVVNWADVEGNLSAAVPVKDTDYTMTLDATNWVEIDGYYYYKNTVAPRDLTGILIESCKPIENRAPDGYALQVTILADGIQSDPVQAIRDAWGIDPDKWTTTTAIE